MSTQLEIKVSPTGLALRCAWETALKQAGVEYNGLICFVNNGICAFQVKQHRLSATKDRAVLIRQTRRSCSRAEKSRDPGNSKFVFSY